MLDWLPLEWLQSGIWLELLELMRHGGVMIVPIGICSLITVLVIIERWMMLRSGRVLPKKLLFELREQVEIRPRKISNLKPSDTHPVGRILLHGMTVLPCTHSHFKESLQDQARREKHVLEKGLVSLEVIAGVAPLFGLLGTALGMISVFQDLSLEGPDRAESLSRGISEALITTVSGLGVGIPALIAFVLFSRKVETLLLRIEEEIMFLHDRLTPGQSAGKKASAKTKS